MARDTGRDNLNLPYPCRHDVNPDRFSVATRFEMAAFKLWILSDAGAGAEHSGAIIRNSAECVCVSSKRCRERGRVTTTIMEDICE
jgi:hypothetical protein